MKARFPIAERSLSYAKIVKNTLNVFLAAFFFAANQYLFYI